MLSWLLRLPILPPRQLFELFTEVRGVTWGQVCIVALELKGTNPYCLLVCLFTHPHLLLSAQINKFVHNRRGNDRNCGVLYIRHVTYQKWAIPLLRGRIPTLRYYPMPIARFCIRLSTYNAHAYIFILPITPPNATVPMNVPYLSTVLVCPMSDDNHSYYHGCHKTFFGSQHLIQTIKPITPVLYVPVLLNKLLTAGTLRW